MKLQDIHNVGISKGVRLGLDEEDFGALVRGDILVVNIKELGVQFELTLGAEVTYDRMFLHIERFVRDKFPEKAEI